MPPFALADWSATSPAAQAGISLVALALALWCCWRWLGSELGLAWRMIRDDECAAAACGVDVQSAKSAAFLLSGVLSGLAGALYAHWIGFISPEQFGLLLSFELLMLAFIGGVRSLAGAIWGAMVFVSIPQFISLLRDHLPATLSHAAGFDLVALGLVIVVVVVFRPQGIAGR